MEGVAGVTEIELRVGGVFDCELGVLQLAPKNADNSNIARNDVGSALKMVFLLRRVRMISIPFDLGGLGSYDAVSKYQQRE